MKLLRNWFWRTFWTFEIGIFQFFYKFLSDEVETVFWENETEPSKPIKLVIGNFLEKGFEATLRSKMNVLRVSKGTFSVFCNFWATKLKPFSGKARKNIKKLFESKFGHRTLFRKWFWSFLELKNQCCGRLKIAFFSFLQLFDWRSWNFFLGKWGKVFKTI